MEQELLDINWDKPLADVDEAWLFLLKLHDKCISVVHNREKTTHPWWLSHEILP